jgi:7-cyano-7-deazaguanine synthase
MTRAVVLLSGGLDSATALAIARARGDECHTLAFDYGQRHRAELAAARRVSAALGAAGHRELRLPIGELGGSALTDKNIAVPEHGGSGIPITYVPARNTVFLSFALALAEVLDAGKIVIGVNAIDYSGYPDCRPEYIAAFQALARLATKRGRGGWHARHRRAARHAIEGGHHSPRPRARRGLLADRVVLSG